ncbi:MAG: hypothetical protein G01um10148_86 [Parcubacteria group bacterium Gr01-1014_8]|nr:MAG: hypothetical protein G01um10148_86 [Parcubacteria group bacterium Gr01-1014_8]
MQHFSKEDAQELRSALEAEKNNLEQELREHGKKQGGDWQGTAAGFSGNEPDETDLADTMEELATNVPLVEALEARLKDVMDALAKMDSGTYGICEKTGKPIPIARLRANPAARTHVEHS